MEFPGTADAFLASFPPPFILRVLSFELVSIHFKRHSSRQDGRIFLKFSVIFLGRFCRFFFGYRRFIAFWWFSSSDTSSRGSFRRNGWPLHVYLRPIIFMALLFLPRFHKWPTGIFRGRPFRLDFVLVFTGFYRVLLFFVGIYWVLLGTSDLCWHVTGFTRVK